MKNKVFYFENLAGTELPYAELTPKGELILETSNRMFGKQDSLVKRLNEKAIKEIPHVSIRYLEDL